MLFHRHNSAFIYLQELFVVAITDVKSFIIISSSSITEEIITTIAEESNIISEGSYCHYQGESITGITDFKS